MVVNIPVCIDADNLGEAVSKNIKQEVREELRKKINEAVLQEYGYPVYRTTRYSDDGYVDLVDSAWADLAKKEIRSELDSLVKTYVKDNREEIIEKICIESADRILRSSKNKNEIVEKLLKLLTCDNQQITRG